MANTTIFKRGWSLVLFIGAGIAASQTAVGQSNSTMPSGSLVRATSQRWASSGFHTKFVHVNGVALFVAEAGKGDPVVLLHGYPESGEEWLTVAPALAKTHHVIVVDLRGMGLSEASKAGFDLANVAEDIHQVVKSRGYTRVKVAGHDWGGAVGAVYALRYRSEVTRLAFLESALAGGGFEKLWSFSKKNDAFTFIPFLLMGGSDSGNDSTADLIRGHEAIFLHHLWEGFVGDKLAAPFSTWKPYVSAMKRPGAATSGASYYRSAYRSADEVRALIAQKLEIPVLSIAGEKAIGSHQLPFVQAFAANIKGNVVLTGAGHFLPEERSLKVAAALKSFFME